MVHDKRIILLKLLSFLNIHQLYTLTGRTAGMLLVYSQHQLLERKGQEKKTHFLSSVLRSPRITVILFHQMYYQQCVSLHSENAPSTYFYHSIKYLFSRLFSVTLLGSALILSVRPKAQIKQVREKRHTRYQKNSRKAYCVLLY